jgi:hypothetical protein
MVLKTLQVWVLNESTVEELKVLPHERKWSTCPFTSISRIGESHKRFSSFRFALPVLAKARSGMDAETHPVEDGKGFR